MRGGLIVAPAAAVCVTSAVLSLGSAVTGTAKAVRKRLVAAKLSVLPESAEVMGVVARVGSVPQGHDARNNSVFPVRRIVQGKNAVRMIAMAHADGVTMAIAVRTTAVSYVSQNVRARNVEWMVAGGYAAPVSSGKIASLASAMAVRPAVPGKSVVMMDVAGSAENVRWARNVRPFTAWVV